MMGFGHDKSCSLAGSAPSASQIGARTQINKKKSNDAFQQQKSEKSLEIDKETMIVK